MSRRQPYNGSQMNLVMAVDLGTTFSGVSYSVLDPGVVPEIKGVTRFPGQAPGGSSKIPSVIYYDRAGSVRAVGAETLLEATLERAEDEIWFKTEWFKMHLRPRAGSMLNSTRPIPSLPPHKSLVDVLADYLQYLVKHSKQFIRETVMPDGAGFITSVERRMIYILSHPNGWEGPQQEYMRRAAIKAGLISEAEFDRERIRFVTEGEASVHFCINNGLTIRGNEGIIVVDAGGGTIDLSAYASSPNAAGGLSLKEISQPQCCFAGSIYVTEESRNYFENRLLGSRFYGDVDRITECFDQTTKLQFRDEDEPSYVRFGGARDRDPALDIRAGQMKIPGTEVARFFQPSIQTILSAISQQHLEALTSLHGVTSVFLVGGFAASPWLFARLWEELNNRGIELSRPDTHVNKAVADGAVSYYLDHFITARISRAFYGLRCLITYRSDDPEHQRRGPTLNLVNGKYEVTNSFSVVLKKGVQVSETQEFRARYYTSSLTPPRNIAYNILKYQGTLEDPSWTDVDATMYSTACTVTADVSQISDQLVPMRSPQGSLFYEIDFDIVLCFGLTELKAQIAWDENGVERRSPALLVYEPIA